MFLAGNHIEFTVLGRFGCKWKGNNKIKLREEVVNMINWNALISL